MRARQPRSIPWFPQDVSPAYAKLLWNELNPSVHNLAYAEELLDRFQHDPASVPESWRDGFALERVGNGAGTLRLAPAFRARSIFNPADVPVKDPAHAPRRGARENSLHDRLDELIRNYRVRGHMIARIDPLGTERPGPPELNLEYYAFTEQELDLLTNSATLPYDRPLSVREIFERLRNTYCRSIGVQFMHIDDVAVRRWIQQRMEHSENRLELSREVQLRILTRLTDAVIFEEFLRKKFVGAKTFSLEGCETLVPLLDLAIEQAGGQGVRDIVLGMAHRGRLNVLMNIVGKDPCAIFREFTNADSELWMGRGDVRHHLGHSGDWTTAEGAKVHLSLCFNPSHLEFVNPVVLGRVRARQDRFNDVARRSVLGVLIHGDASFAGEGIVQETLNFSRLPGYRVGGVLHVILNNQIGFTTPPGEGRSTPYATDVARLLQVPIFHVNGEDPEAVAHVVRLAMDFRHEFRSDVFIDMYGYRRWGHNETDEPSFTQPMLYQAIQRRVNVREGYLQQLLKLNGVTAEEAGKLASERRENLEQSLAAAPTTECSMAPEQPVAWRDYFGGAEPAEEPDTRVEGKRLSELLRQLAQIPDGFTIHSKLERLMLARREMADGAQPLDWSAAEALALATLAVEGIPVRVSGQDTARGTFSQRHAVLHDQKDGRLHVPLQHLAPQQAFVEILNSPLNETGVLGFEYGYSLDRPNGLILWEAQFGDFANAGQVIIDQFLASAEDKWQRLSGLVLLLPHGFEGMGAEHSSARIERFLSLAAEDNLQIVQPTTPAQYFHCLRRQALWHWRKPLVVFTPKSLLRHPRVVSSLDDCAEGCFQRILPDNNKVDGRVLLCTGKVYYELEAHRQAQHREDVALVRLEQLYPLRAESVQGALSCVGENHPIFWVQEEPENMGAWHHLRGRFGDSLLGRWPWKCIGRPESASPATGSSAAHQLEQADLIRRAFGDEASPADPA